MKVVVKLAVWKTCGKKKRRISNLYAFLDIEILHVKSISF